MIVMLSNFFLVFRSFKNARMPSLDTNNPAKLWKTLQHPRAQSLQLDNIVRVDCEVNVSPWLLLWGSR